MPVLTECLHRTIALTAAGRGVLRSSTSVAARHCRCTVHALSRQAQARRGAGAGTGAGAGAVAGTGNDETPAAESTDVTQNQYIRARLLSRSALSIQQPVVALEHALTAVRYCGTASDWPCAMAHFELSFVHNKLGNTSAAIDAFKTGVGPDTGADDKLTPPQPAKQQCSVLHNGTVQCASAPAPTPEPDNSSAVQRAQSALLRALRHVCQAPFDWLPAEPRWMRCRASCHFPSGRGVNAYPYGAGTPYGQLDARGPQPSLTVVRHVLANYLLGAPWSLVRTGFAEHAGAAMQDGDQQTGQRLARAFGADPQRYGLAGGNSNSSAVAAPLPSMTLVVAHYNEDLRWLASSAVQDMFDNVYVYTKSAAAGRSANSLRSVLPLELRAHAQTEFDAGDHEGKLAGATVHVRQLPNVGRESHTFLHHVAHEYDGDIAKADGVAFVQGEPHHAHDLRTSRTSSGECAATTALAGTATASPSAASWPSFCVLGTEYSLSTRDGYPHVPPVLPLGAHFDALFQRNADTAADAALGAEHEHLFMFGNGGQFHGHEGGAAPAARLILQSIVRTTIAAAPSRRWRRYRWYCYR